MPLPPRLVDSRPDLDRLWRVLGEPNVVPGWATVELDRAEAERAPTAVASSAERRTEDAPDDELLGARCRLVTRDSHPIEVLLEPSTEGRLAASLARFGEGPAAAYLLAGPEAVDLARRAGSVLSAGGRGPLGRQRLVVSGPRWGPHVILVMEPRATIGR
jgi:hypothetical protein